MRWTVLLLSTACLLATAPSGLAQDLSTGPHGLHLAYGEDPATSMTVSWIGPPGDQAYVTYGQGPDLDQRQDATRQALPGSPQVAYHAMITDLEPGTTYQYEVHIDQASTSAMPMTTAPAPQQPEALRITAFADHGTVHPANTRADGDAPQRVLELAADALPDLHLHAGDTSYAEGDSEQWNAYLDQIEPLASQAPYMTVPGNHEREAGLGYANYDARFAMPIQSEPAEGRWWDIQVGDVLIVGLSSERACQRQGMSAEDPMDPADDCETNEPIEPYEPQLAWFEETLAEAQDDETIDWRIVLTHHLFWSSSIHGSAQGYQDHYMSLVDRYGVDLVIQGHDHVYERSKVLHDGDLSEQGTVYLTNGAAGSGTYDWTGDQPQWSAFRDNEHYGVLVLDVAPSRVDGRFLTLEDGVIDRFSLVNADGEGVEAGPSAGGGQNAPDAVPGPGLAAAMIGLLGALAVATRRAKR